MTNNEKENKEKIKAIFEAAEKLPLDSDPFMKTRILAELRIAQEKKRSLIWKSFAFAGPVIVAVTLLLVFFFYGPSFKASINQNILVKIEIEETKSKIAFAEIELPKGVYFYSKLYPEISKNRTLVLAVDDNFASGHIPIVIRSEEVGSKKLKINFLGTDQRLVEKRYIKINFINSA